MHDGAQTWKLAAGSEVLRPLVRLLAGPRRDDPGDGHGLGPWYLANTDDKRRGRLNIISHLLAQVPYEPQKPLEIKLPRGQKAHGYEEPDYRFGSSPPRTSGSFPPRSARSA